MHFSEISRRIDIFAHIKPQVDQPDWQKACQYHSCGNQPLVLADGYWYFAFSTKSGNHNYVIAVVRSRDGLEWEDTEFPFINKDNQSDATMCVDSSGTIHLCYQHNYYKTGYSRFTNGVWSRIIQIGQFPEFRGFDTADQFLISSTGELILLGTREQEGKLYARRLSGNQWGEMESWPLGRHDILQNAFMDKSDAIHLLLHNHESKTASYLKKPWGQDWDKPEEIPCGQALAVCMAINDQGEPHVAAFSQEELQFHSKDQSWNTRKVCPINLGEYEILWPSMWMTDNSEAQIFWMQSAFPLYRGSQAFSVSTAEGVGAIPVNLSHDDSQDSNWVSPVIGVAGDQRALVIPNQHTFRPYWFCPVHAIPERWDHRVQWRKILAARDPASALYDYFLPVVKNQATQARLKAMLSRVVSVSTLEGALHIKFQGDYTWLCAAPDRGDPGAQVPASYAEMVQFSGRMVLDCPERAMIAYGGLDRQGRLETFKGIKQATNFCARLKQAGLQPEDTAIAAYYGKTVLIFNPLIKNQTGEAAICRLDQKTWGISAPLQPEMGFGDLFFAMVIDTIAGENTVFPRAGTTVQIAYSVWDSQGRLFEEKTAADNYLVVLGQSHFIPGLEALIAGANIGQKLSFTLPAEKAFGSYDPQLVVKAAKSEFPESRSNPNVGDIVVIDMGDGLPRDYRVSANDEEHLTLDGNHPLADQAVRLDIEIIAFHQATPVQLNSELLQSSEDIYQLDSDAPQPTIAGQDYLNEWQNLVVSQNPAHDLQAHFGFLAGSDELRALLAKVCAKASRVSIDKSNLLIDFQGGFVLECAPPSSAVLDERIPSSCRAIAEHHSSLCLEGDDTPLVFAGPNIIGELPESEFANQTYSDLDEPVGLALYFHQDEIVYAPSGTTDQGEPLLAWISHESCMVIEKYDAGLDEVLLRLIAQDILRRDIHMPLHIEAITIADKQINRDCTELDLSDCGLTSLPPEIGLLRNLQKLHLDQNALESLPEEIGNLTKLEELWLLNNKLKELPASFSKLINLEELVLSGNPLESLPTSMEKLKNLQKIYLDQPLPGISKFKNLEVLHIHQIGAELAELDTLRELHLSNDSEQPFPDEMPPLRLLHTLWLSGPFKELPLYVCSLPELAYLNMAFNESLLSLPPEIGQLTKLRKICLNGCTLLADIPETVTSLQNLITWESSHTALTQQSIENLCSLSSLEVLNLQNVPMKTLPAGLANLKNLSNLNLKECGLKDHYANQDLKAQIASLLPKTCRVSIDLNPAAPIQESPKQAAPDGSAKPSVGQGQAVRIAYSVRNENAQLIEQVTEADQFWYLHGYNNIPPIVEQTLQGQSVGFTSKLYLKPEEGFGESDPNLIRTISKTELSPDQSNPEIGQLLEIEVDDDTLLFRVEQVDDTQVTLNANHPLAGKKLGLWARIYEIRPASKKEIEVAGVLSARKTKDQKEPNKPSVFHDIALWHRLSQEIFANTAYWLDQLEDKIPGIHNLGVDKVASRLLMFRDAGKLTIEFDGEVWNIDSI